MLINQTQLRIGGGFLRQPRLLKVTKPWIYNIHDRNIHDIILHNTHGYVIELFVCEAGVVCTFTFVYGLFLLLFFLSFSFCLVLFSLKFQISEHENIEILLPARLRNRAVCLWAGVMCTFGGNGLFLLYCFFSLSLCLFFSLKFQIGEDENILLRGQTHANTDMIMVIIKRRPRGAVNVSKCLDAWKQ